MNSWTQTAFLCTRPKLHAAGVVCVRNVCSRMGGSPFSDDPWEEFLLSLLEERLLWLWLIPTRKNKGSSCWNKEVPIENKRPTRTIGFLCYATTIPRNLWFVVVLKRRRRRRINPLILIPITFRNQWSLATPYLQAIKYSSLWGRIKWVYLSGKVNGNFQSQVPTTSDRSFTKNDHSHFLTEMSGWPSYNLTILNPLQKITTKYNEADYTLTREFPVPKVKFIHFQLIIVWGIHHKCVSLCSSWWFNFPH